MKLVFTNQELADLARLRDQAAECRRIAQEVEIGKGAAKDLSTSFQAAQQTVDDIPPSEWLRSSARATDAAAKLSNARLLKDAVACSTEKLGSRLMGLGSELRINLNNQKNVLHNKIVRAHPDAHSSVYADDLQRIGVIAGEPAVCMETLLKLAVEFGAEIPEAAA